MRRPVQLYSGPARDYGSPAGSIRECRLNDQAAYCVRCFFCAASPRWRYQRRSPPRYAPHRALYTMILASSRTDSGVVDARGTMQYEWGESCDGWTIEQRYRLRMRYGETPDADIVSSFVTWESKDGLRYRFNQKQTSQRRARSGHSWRSAAGRARKRRRRRVHQAETADPEADARRAVPERAHDPADRQSQ